MAKDGTRVATSIDRAPLDEPHVEGDGDNSVLALRFPEHARKLGLSLVGDGNITGTVGIAPFGRVLKEGARGEDVVAVKRALHAWKPTSISNKTQTYGPKAVRAVRLLQKAHDKPQTGIYDKPTHSLLAPYFDAWGVWLLMHSQHTLALRKRVVMAGLAVYNYHRLTGRVHYTEGKDRMSIVRLKLKPPFTRVIREDCSSYITACFYVAGAADPNGLHYNGEGYTGTLGEHGRVVRTPFPGDIILYPSAKTPLWPWAHTALAIGDDVNKPATRCLSHGREGDPLILPITYRRIGQFRSFI
jgi:putative peptidoglycan binding protein